MQSIGSSASHRLPPFALLAFAMAAAALLPACGGSSGDTGADAATSAICDAGEAGGTACRVSEGGHCVPHGSAFLCDFCPNGFTVAATSDACIDVNECATNNGGCAQTCTNSPGGYACSCGAGYAVANDGRGCTTSADGSMDAAVTAPDGMVAAGCTTSNDPVTADMAQPVVIFTINRLQLPRVAGPDVFDGCNVDGLATSTNTQASGCFVTDAKATSTSSVADVDNTFGMMGEVITNLGLDLSGALQAAVAPASGPASVEVRVALANWNHTLDDGCVTVSLYAGTPGSPTLLGSRIATLDAGVSGVITGFAPATLTLATTAPPGCLANPSVTCANTQTQDCDAALALTLYGLRTRLHLAPASGGGFQLVTNRPDGASPVTDVVDPTLLAGYVYWGAKSGQTVTGTFAYEYQSYLCELGQGAQWSTIQGIAADKLDLHSTASGNDRALSSCSGSSAMNSNANTHSFGAYAGSGY